MVRFHDYRKSLNSESLSEDKDTKYLSVLYILCLCNLLDLDYKLIHDEMFHNKVYLQNGFGIKSTIMTFMGDYGNYDIISLINNPEENIKDFIKKHKEDDLIIGLSNYKVLAYKSNTLYIPYSDDDEDEFRNECLLQIHASYIIIAKRVKEN